MTEPQLDRHRSMDELGKFAVNLEMTNVDLDSTGADELLRTVMTRVTEDCLAGGADFIGHVKGCLLTPDDRLLRANLVSMRTGVESEDLLDGKGFKGGRMMLHVIVHGIWDPEVRRISLEAISSILKERSIEHRIILDYCESVV